MTSTTPYTFSVAPMMDYTDRHYRYLMRLIAKDVRLYTEMITSQALILGGARHLLDFNQEEHPIALQLGGSEPDLLAQSAKLGEDYGYDEINLNVGCPSPRVQKGAFGACLMKEPDLVAESVAAMCDAVSIPVTVKCRLGVDEQDSYPELVSFIEKVSATGCDTFIIHARKAWLKGLSPKENRDIPPLKYDWVYDIKKQFPHLRIIINGGIKTTDEVKAHLQYTDGVMLGREINRNPFWLADLQQELYGEKTINRIAVVEQFKPYIDNQLKQGVKLLSIVRHMLGLFTGQPGAGKWRRYISEHACQRGAGLNVLDEAINLVC